MNSKSTSSGERYFFEDEQYEQRCGRRLRAELGVNQAGVEVILRMRREMLQLLGRVRQLENELDERRASRSARLAQYRLFIYETGWWDETDLNEDER